MNKHFINIFLVFVLSSIAFYTGDLCFTAEGDIYDKEVSLVQKIQNFHVVSPNVMRGSQPSEEGFKLLKEYCNIKTVLSLRNNKESNEWEKDVVEKLGMKFINIPMSGTEEQSIKKIEQCLSLMHSESNQPIFIHCLAGKDRTGLILAAYRIKYGGWDISDALREMFFYGYNPVCCFKLKESLVKWDEWRKANLKTPGRFR